MLLRHINMIDKADLLDKALKKAGSHFDPKNFGPEKPSGSQIADFIIKEVCHGVREI